MHANVVLDTGVDREACTNNLAPTSSTTCTLVMGDALAVALSVERNFQPKDFARFHPGGKLGRQLLMRVSDVMCKSLPLIGLDSSIHDAIVLMTKMRKGVVFITDADEHSIIGIFTDGDLRRAMLNKQFDLNALVKNHMVDNPISIISNATLKEAEALFIDKKVHCLIVIDGSTNAPVGMIELFDL
jgi:arabinose-5-phosphate isomerase